MINVDQWNSTEAKKQNPTIFFFLVRSINNYSAQYTIICAYLIEKHCSLTLTRSVRRLSLKLQSSLISSIMRTSSREPLLQCSWTSAGLVGSVRQPVEELPKCTKEIRVIMYYRSDKIILCNPTDNVLCIRFHHISIFAKSLTWLQWIVLFLRP